MRFLDRSVITLGKFISNISKLAAIGAGATWPGEIALKLRPNIAASLAQQLRKGVILIAGTNGKTTTSLMIKKILERQGNSVVHNASGANLLNGVVSAFVQDADWFGKTNADWGVFEIDENSLPGVIANTPILQYSNIKKKLIIVLLNLFRDQLDRYGEVDVIVEKWEKALSKLSKETTFVLNGDDPAIAYLGNKVTGTVIYFGVDDNKHFLPKLEHATDSIFCMNCGGRLTYEGIYYSHIGIWHCERCGQERPKPTISSWPPVLPGLYNQYNTLGAVAAAISIGIAKESIKTSLSDFSPAFGRQEEFVVEGKKIKLFLSKNPAGFNASLRTVLEQGGRNFLFVLNDRVPDGRDVSWIWDVDFETLPAGSKIMTSGDRVYDMALRIEYALENKKFMVEHDVTKALKKSIDQTPKKETLYILPTYSAMLEIRKIITGRKIL